MNLYAKETMKLCAQDRRLGRDKILVRQNESVIKKKGHLQEFSRDMLHRGKDRVDFRGNMLRERQF